jgi:hypothetical protein
MTFSSYADLLDQIGAVDITVPSIASGRTKQHTERWTMFRFLTSCAQGKAFEFPLGLTHRDKPDFWIQMPTHSVGAEITLAMPEDFARALVLREKFYPNAPIDLSEFAWGTPRRTSKELLKLIETWQSRLTGLGWVGDQVEIEWAQHIRDTIQAKMLVLNKPHFDKHDYNWLLIYDNIPQGSLHLDKALNLLMGYLAEAALAFQPGTVAFDSISIETGSSFATIEDARYVVNPINNVWRKRSV